MLFWFATVLVLSNVSFAEVGKITKMIGAEDAYLVRGSEKILLQQDLNLEEGDELSTQNTVVVAYLYPTTQLSLSKNTQIKISQNLIEDADSLEKTTSVIDYVKGIIRAQVTKDKDLEINQRIQTKDVAFAVRGTEFEVSQDGDDFDLDVIEGEVEVSSPHVQTFVPEIVKASEGFRFNRKKYSFERRKFAQKFAHHPAFARAEEIRQRRQERREKRRGQKLSQRGARKLERRFKKQRGRK
jgi:hypothetical protein